MLKGPLASLERHDRPAFEGRSGSERSTEPGSSAKTVASQPVVAYRIRSRTAKKEILVKSPSLYQAGFRIVLPGYIFNRAPPPVVRVFAISANGVASELRYRSVYEDGGREFRLGNH